MYFLRPLLLRAGAFDLHGPSLFAFLSLILPPWLLWHQLGDPGADALWLVGLVSLFCCWGAFRLLPQLPHPKGALRGALLGWALLLSLGWIGWRLLQGAYLFEWYPTDSPIIENYFAGNPLTFIYNKAHIKAALGELLAAVACWAAVLFLGSALWRFKAPLKLDPRTPILLIILFFFNLQPGPLTPDIPHWSEFLATGWGVLNGRITYISSTSFYGLLMPLIPAVWVQFLGLSQLSLLGFTLAVHLFSFWAAYKFGAQVSKSANLAFIGALALQVWAANGLIFSATVPSNSLLRGCLPSLLILWGIWGLLAGRRRKLAAFFCGVALLWEISLAAFGVLGVLLALATTWRRGGRLTLLFYTAAPALLLYLWAWAFHGPVFSPVEVVSFNLEILSAMSKGFSATPQQFLWHHLWAVVFIFFALWRSLRARASASSYTALLAASLPLVIYWIIYSLGRTAANQTHGLIWAMAPAALAYLGLYYRMRQGRPWVAALGVGLLLTMQLPSKLVDPIQRILPPISGDEYNWAKACQQKYININNKETCWEDPPTPLGRKIAYLLDMAPNWRAAYALPRYPFVARACREKIPFLSMLDSLAYFKEDCMFLTELPNAYMLMAKGQLERIRKELSRYPVVLYDDNAQGFTFSELAVQGLQSKMIKQGYLEIPTGIPHLFLWVDPTQDWEDVVERLKFENQEEIKADIHRRASSLAQEAL